MIKRFFNLVSRVFRLLILSKECELMDVQTVGVGVRNDGLIDIDFAGEEDEDGWNFNSLDIKTAKFLHAQLGRAIEQQEEWQKSSEREA